MYVNRALAREHFFVRLVIVSFVSANFVMRCCLFWAHFPLFYGFSHKTPSDQCHIGTWFVSNGISSLHFIFLSFSLIYVSVTGRPLYLKSYFFGSIFACSHYLPHFFIKVACVCCLLNNILCSFRVYDIYIHLILFFLLALFFSFFNNTNNKKNA